MPNRILKESICTSDSIDSLDWFQEVFFYRLIVNCDDFGRMDARPRILFSKLFPLKMYEDVSDYMIESTLEKFQNIGLITLYKVDGKQYLQMKTWERHQQVRAKRSKYPSPDDNTCNQMQSDDYKCPRNPIQSESLSESLSISESEPLIADADAQKIQREQDRILSMAENAGFSKSPMVMARIVDFYTEYGEKKVADAIGECVTHGVTNLAYLNAVLKGSGGSKKPSKKVVAQEYDQRNYKDIQNEIEEQQAARILERLKQEGGG